MQFFDAMHCNRRRQIGRWAVFLHLVRFTRADRKPQRVAHDQTRFSWLRVATGLQVVKQNPQRPVPMLLPSDLILDSEKQRRRAERRPERRFVATVLSSAIRRLPACLHLRSETCHWLVAVRATHDRSASRKRCRGYDLPKEPRGTNHASLHIGIESSQRRVLSAGIYRAPRTDARLTTACQDISRLCNRRFSQ